MDIPTRLVDWPDARRIISTRHPPIHLFEDIADPADWDLIGNGEAKTNPRLAENVGKLDLVPAGRRVSGPGASNVMSPFVHTSTDRAGRFHDGTFGAYYAARTFETALAEHSHHRAIFFRSTAEEPGWFAQYRELVGKIRHRFHDLRGCNSSYATFLDPNDYAPSQRLARRLRSAGSDGIVYPSVRDPAGECVAAFWPHVVGIPVHGRAIGYHFDGRGIDYVRDETSGQVFSLRRDTG
ncbi:MAG: RES family NAD+ phosphorylase [Pseudomonadota bacterium]